MRRIRIFITAILCSGLATSTVQPAFADRTIRCESRDYRYEFCDIRVRGRVRINEEFSRSRCREGRSWGYGRRGVWVDDGCRAEFRLDDYGDDYGEPRGRDRDSDSGDTIAAVAAVAAVIGGVALLSTMLGDQTNNTKASPPPDFGEQGYTTIDGRIPDWAVGTFEGYNTLYDSDLKLTMNRIGDVTMVIDKKTIAGRYQNGQIVMDDGGILDIYQEDSGIRTVRKDQPNSVVRYIRTGS